MRFILMQHDENSNKILKGDTNIDTNCKRFDFKYLHMDS